MVIIQRAKEKMQWLSICKKDSIIKDKAGGVFGEFLIVDKEGAKDEWRST